MKKIMIAIIATPWTMYAQEAAEKAAEVVKEVSIPVMDNSILEQLSQNSGSIGIAALVFLSLNIVLAAAGKILGMIKDKTETNVDNQIHSWIVKIMSWMKMIVEFVGNNFTEKK